MTVLDHLALFFACAATLAAQTSQPTSQPTALPRSFEATRTYSPKLVIDALGCVLSQITGKLLDPDPNNATDAGRDHAVGAWHCYAQYVCR